MYICILNHRLEENMISYHRRYQENTTLLNLLKYIFDILMVILTAYVLVSFSCTRTTILGGSMEPSINNDDTVLVNKFAYAIKGPKRFDCIAFEPDSIGSSKLYVKRVIGLPGETVQIIDGEVYINGELLADEHYGKEVMLDPGIAAESITLGDDEYFVLGDNRNHSSDSRDPSVGVLHRKDLIGRAWVRIWPFSDIGFIRHD
jgi:signal peptidase I